MPIRSFACSVLVLLAVSTRAAAQGATGWVLGLAVDESYDTNVRLRTDGRPNEIVSRLTASLAHGWKGPRHALTLTGSGTEILFRERKELNRFAYAAGAAVDLKLSTRVGLMVSDRYTDTLTSQIDDFTDEGAIFSLTGTQRNRAAMDLKWVLTPQTSLLLNGRHDYWYFEDPALENGWRVSTGGALSHRFGGSEAGSLVYNYSQNRRTETPGEVHVGTLEWSQTLGSRFGATGAFGVSQIRAEGQSATRLNWAAALAWRLERSALDASYSRRSRTSFGLDRQRIVDAVRVGYNLKLSRTLGAIAFAGYSRSTDPFDPTFVLDAQNYGVTFAWAMSPEFSLAAGYAYLRRDTSVSGEDAHRASVSIAYRKAF